jgi:hypothetical protein
MKCIVRSYRSSPASAQLSLALGSYLAGELGSKRDLDEQYDAAHSGIARR